MGSMRGASFPTYDENGDRISLVRRALTANCSSSRSDIPLPLAQFLKIKRAELVLPFNPIYTAEEGRGKYFFCGQVCGTVNVKAPLFEKMVATFLDATPWQLFRLRTDSHYCKFEKRKVGRNF